MLRVTRLRGMRPEDWPDVERIYRQGIASGNATFESRVPDHAHFDAAKLPLGRLVAIDTDAHTERVVGWIAASAVSAREAYRGVVEHSVYVDQVARGRGVGRALLEGFLTEADDAGIWTVQSSIFPENDTSLRLHAALGFRTVGRRERIARSAVGPWAGRWRDTILIERRSSRNGTAS
jgi:phosphinothricin acetyltransferase